MSAPGQTAPDPLGLTRAARAAGSVEAARPVCAEIMRAAVKASRGATLERLRAGDLDGRSAAREIARQTDAVVRGALDVACIFHRNPTPTAAERLSVAAVGGYGRGEMAPFSDVDLLFLTPWKPTPWSESVIESALYLLWDGGLKVGHSARNADDCLRMAREDLTIRTALLEKRPLWGDCELLPGLDARLWRELFERTGPEFVEAKLHERHERHERHGDTRYLLEPNVKEGKGALRDLQTLYWIAKYLYHEDSVAGLVRGGAFSSDEIETFDAAERFLWTVRFHLHGLSNRAQERLTFPLQIEIAEVMGYVAGRGRSGVECFMQDYFRATKDVGDLTRWFCAALEHAQKKPRAALGGMARRLGAPWRRQVARGYALQDGRLAFETPEAIIDAPARMLGIFAESERLGVLVHPGAMRLMANGLDLIDDAMRADPAANRLFLDLLTNSDDPERALRRLNESGVLGRFIPQFGRIVAMMQFNMYHHYTVDEHTIQAIGILRRIEQGALAEDHPVATDVLKAGLDRETLYVALLLHDVGKGLPSDHSETGAAIARDLCPRLGLDPAQCEMVEWLVRRHLLMSDVAQKRDISDPATLRAFAEEVRSPERLRLLLTLTVCDIRAVGPGVWNNWKAQLLRQLYYDTRAVLTGGDERLSRAGRVDDAKAALRALLGAWPAERMDAEIARHYPPYWLGFDPDAHAEFALLAQTHDPRRASIRVDLSPGRDATRVMIYLEDHPGLFSRMAAALALARASVVEARSFTSADGMATAVFHVQDADGAAYAPARFDTLRRTIRRALAGELTPRAALAERRRNQRGRDSHFVAPTRILFDNEASDLYTVIEVETRDRIGLLYDLTAALAASSINMFSAVIATYGEQAVDVFYVKDLFGLKIRSSDKQKAIARRVREAIERAAQEGGGAEGGGAGGGGA